MEFLAISFAIAIVGVVQIRRVTHRRTAYLQLMSPGSQRTFWKYKWEDASRCPDKETCPIKKNGSGGVRRGKSKTIADECMQCGLRVQEWSDEYTSWRTREGFLIEGNRKSPLVSSLLPGGQGDGCHAPAIDLDFPVAGEMGPEGGELTFHVNAKREAWIRVVELLSRTNLVNVEWAEKEIARLRDLKYEFTSYRESAEATFTPTLSFSCPGNVIASSTPGHYHLYLDARLSWVEYLEILHALCEAGLVEKGYLEMSAYRRMTLLRKPGIKKTDPGAGGTMPPNAWRFE